MSLPPHPTTPCPVQTQGSLKFRNGYRAHGSFQEMLSCSDMRSRKARKRRGKSPSFPFFLPLSFLHSLVHGEQYPKLCSIQTSEKESFFSNQRSSGVKTQGRSLVLVFVFVFCLPAAGPWTTHSQDIEGEQGKESLLFWIPDGKGNLGNQKVLRRSWGKRTWGNESMKLLMNSRFSTSGSSEL